VKRKHHRKIHKHHTIGFENIESIDWHLRNLWDGGWQVIIELTPAKHKKHHKKKTTKRYKHLNRMNSGIYDAVTWQAIKTAHLSRLKENEK
jgi:ABC-type nickel/cobalt efflux system permease component RcnA